MKEQTWQGRKEVVASRRELAQAGWTEAKDLQADQWWPHSGEIVFARGDEALRHVYSVREDGSDYPGKDEEVRWTHGRIKTETIVRRTFKVT